MIYLSWTASGISSFLIKQRSGIIYIGIFPSYAPLHRGGQHFNRDDDVFDVMHYDDLGRFKARFSQVRNWKGDLDIGFLDGLKAEYARWILEITSIQNRRCVCLLSMYNGTVGIS